MTGGVLDARGTVAERLAAGAVRTPDGCLTWQRAKSSRGYGDLWANGRLQRAHRVAWELANGSIPADLTVDHLCRTKACVDPTHMEIVTREENSRRGSVNTGKTHCRHGHELAGDNLYLKPAGGRACRTCKRRLTKEHDARVRAQRMNTEFVPASRGGVAGDRAAEVSPRASAACPTPAQ